MKETKANILVAALNLFNKQGFVNVRLQHIADEAFVSIGNLAYHFENKREILHGLYEILVHKQVDLLNELNIVPLFENLDRHWHNVFEIQMKYAFFYQDTLEVLRYDDQITEKYRKHIYWEKEQYHRMLQFNISRGALEIPSSDDLKEKAELMWLMENSWLQRSLISGKTISEAKVFKNHMWLSITPYLSQLGKPEYDQLIKNKAIPL